MLVHIEDLRFRCIIGILDFERDEPQDVVVNLTIDYNYSDKNDFINYATVAQILKSQMINEKFELIEDALESLSKRLIKEFHLINELYLKITKPSILPDCMVSVSNTYKSQS